MNHINCNETLFQIEDLMLNICLNRYYWRDAIVELERNREAATTIYDPELEYSPLLQGYFDLMSMSHASDSGRTINPRRSPLQSRTAFQNFCDGLMDEQDHFILKHKRQRKRNYTAIKNTIVRALLNADITITDRRYIAHEDDTGYHHFAIDVAKDYEYLMEEQ